MHRESVSVLIFTTRMKPSVVLALAILASVCSGDSVASPDGIVHTLQLPNDDAETFRRDPIDYSWSVNLLLRQDGKLVRNCGGVRISPQYLLTAASCVDKANYPEATSIDVVHAAITNNYTSDWLITDMSFQYATCRIHPQYDPGNLINNIAVVLQDQLFQYKNAPSLPALRDENNTFVNESGYMFKWINKTSKADTADRLELYAVPTTIMEHSICKAIYPDLSESHFCGTNLSGRKIDPDDEGVPLVIKDTDSKLVVIGIGCPMNYTTSSKFPPLVFTRVSRYSEWIHFTSRRKVPINS